MRINLKYPVLFSIYLTPCTHLKLSTSGALTDLEKQYGPLMHNPRASARSPLGPKSLAGHSTQRFKRSYSSLSPNMTLKAAAAAASLSGSPKPVGPSTPAASSVVPAGHHSPPPPSSTVVAAAAFVSQATVHHGAPAHIAASAPAIDPTLASSSTPTSATSPALTSASAESASFSSTANTRSNGDCVNVSVTSSAAPVSAASNTGSGGASAAVAKASGNRVRQPPPNVDVTHALARDLLALVATATEAASMKSKTAAHDEEQPVDLGSSAATRFSADALLSPALRLRPSKALLGKQ